MKFITEWFGRRAALECDGEIDSIVWISMPRSGSTYMCDLLSFHPDMDVHFELFHRGSVYCRDFDVAAERIRKRFNRVFESPRDPELIALAHRDPLEFMEALRAPEEKRILSFKVFPHHLRKRDLQKAILGNRRIAKVFLKRNLLASYVSNEKALVIRTWEKTDTTHVKVTLRADAFSTYVSQMEAWFKSVENYLERSKQEFSVVHYEDLVSQGSDHDRLCYLVAILRAQKVPLRDLSILDMSNLSIERQRQDNSESLKDKIENYEEFEAEMRLRGLERFLD